MAVMAVASSSSLSHPGFKFFRRPHSGIFLLKQFMQSIVLVHYVPNQKKKQGAVFALQPADTC